ncbi:uncharacterized protein [Amphiura filiformis]|uniref:uncharacterized protein isoform X2 n=1 Tax=Amphiura filiformis TaxID=82378 RepID=UPI003B20C024
MAYETPPPAYPVVKVESDFVTLQFSLVGGFSKHYDLLVFGDETILDELYPHISSMTSSQTIKRKPDVHCLKVNVGASGLLQYTQIQFFKMLASRGFTMKASNVMQYPRPRPQYEFFFAR